MDVPPITIQVPNEQKRHAQGGSSSSAIDLPATTAGLSSVPPSPSLGPLETRTTATRRRSWGQDPLDLSKSGGSNITNAGSKAPPSFILTDDPFRSPTQTNFEREYASYPMENAYSTAQAGPSSASLMPPDSIYTTRDDDDEVHLTRDTSYRLDDADWTHEPDDPERVLGGRKRTLRYSTAPSPLKRTGTAMKSVSRSLRRASFRVVNFAGEGVENQIRLDDDEPRPVGKREEDEGSHRAPIVATPPLRGRTLGFFGPTNPLRLTLYHLLVSPWTEPAILCLIIVNAVVLTIQAAKPLVLPEPDADGVSLPLRVTGYFHTWEDYTLFVLFVLYTLEAFTRMIVTGFILDPSVPISTLFRSPFASYTDARSATAANVSLARQGSLLRQKGPLSQGITMPERIDRLNANLQRPFALQSDVVNPPPINEKAEYANDEDEFKRLPFQISVTAIHGKTQRNLPYLRSSWSRVDFVAIVSYWVTFVLAMLGLERGEFHIGVFRAMSVLRTARLLAITSGTTTIMHSLKTARPLLTSVALFVLFATVLLSVIGVQSFKGSMLRQCSLSSTLGEPEISLGQACGGFIDPVFLNETSYFQQDGTLAKMDAKGYICPLGQVCMELENPNNGMESFDNIGWATLQVVIAATANGWTPVMYAMIDAEFFVSAIFFIVSILVLNFWLINLFVAVITNTFSAIRSATQKSAFGASNIAVDPNKFDDGWATNGRQVARANPLKAIYAYTKYVWILFAFASLTLQATREVEVSTLHQRLLDDGELALTIAFDIEIIWRVLAELPDWRAFFKSGTNWLDLSLALVSTVIQIPVIHESSAYAWFTIFQLARFYRVILVVPRMRPLLLSVFGNMYGLANMTLFLFLINFLAALVGVQLVRGDISGDDDHNFGELWNAFLAVYAVGSSEDWPNVLYGTMGAEAELGQSVIVGIFVSTWMLFANFIILQMFIAVINENFEVAEAAKQSKQASSYWQNTHITDREKETWVDRMNPYRWVKPNPPKDDARRPSTLGLLMQKELVQDWVVTPRVRQGSQSVPKLTQAGHSSSKSLGALQRLFNGDGAPHDMPLRDLNHAREGSTVDAETERFLDLIASRNGQVVNADELILQDAIYQQRAKKAEFIHAHPTYDKSFWILSQDNFLRRCCQRVVYPAGGERLFGKPTEFGIHFQLLVFAAVVGGIVVECFATPLYRREHYKSNGFVPGAWFDVTEAALGFTLAVEFLIKIIADGFIWTPNAYLSSIWNILDFIIMVGLVVNASTSLLFIGGLSRFTRSLKALRAIRLISLIDRMRETVQSLIFSGALRILDAAVLAILYMIPYAVWGLNIFAGLMVECNDGGVGGRLDCTGEFTTTVHGEAFGFPVPRVWDHPAPSTVVSFDSFQSSLLLLFEIVSLEGWVDAMNFANSITGKDQQPQNNANQFYAIFFVVYNLMGAVVILTLFVSIIIGNFSSQTGTAFLTQPQREWIDLQKLFARQRPSKRPHQRPTLPVRAWCFDRAVSKHGIWARSMTFMFVAHIIMLMTQSFEIHPIWDQVREWFFLSVAMIYLLDTAVRFYGLGWHSFFANGWHLFDLIVSIASAAASVLIAANATGFVLVLLQKLFLVLIALKLVQKSNNLNKLFKTAMASLPAIISLLALWTILFIFFAILNMEIFSLTKWGSGENHNMNYTSIGNAMVMQAFMSVGEGWNQYMHDYAIEYPRCTLGTVLEPESDCGSVAWAFSIFMAWNVISMYIFVNLFTGVVVENFSYVFQSSGGSKAITREEMRTFKKLWAEHAEQQTGLLPRNRFVKFFGRLSGVFEVRVYTGEYRTRRMVELCKEDNPEAVWPSRVVAGIDLGKLQKVVSTIDCAAVQKRRNTYLRLYHEARVAHRNPEGMTFTEVLLLLAHHKLIVDRDALVMKDLVNRTEVNKLVTDLVNLDRVRSLLRTMSIRREYLSMREAHRANLRHNSQSSELSADIPEIKVVDTGGPVTPPRSTRDITSNPPSAHRSAWSVSTGDRFSSVDPFTVNEVPLSPISATAGSRLSRHLSNLSTLSADIGGFPLRRETSPFEDDDERHRSLQTSLWRDKMMEAEDPLNRP